MATEYFNDAWRIPNNKNQSLVSNYSMEFNGTSDYIDLGTSLSFPNEYTISCWININNTTAGAKAIIYKGTTTSYEFGLEVNRTSGKLSTLGRSNGPIFTSNTTLVAGVWYHAALTKTIVGVTKTYTFFLNGISDGGGVTNSDPIYSVGITAIGRYGSSSIGYFNGKLDQVSIFDYALPATGTNSVATLYGGGTAVTNPMALNPVAYYQLGDQSVDNGANYLVPNNSLQDYVFQTTPSGSPHISIPSITISEAATISIWVNIISFSGGTQQTFFGDQTNTKLSVNNQSGVIRVIYSGESGLGLKITTLVTSDFINKWHHIALVQNGGAATVYIDGNSEGNITGTLRTPSFAAIGALASGAGTLNGFVSNAAIFSTDLQPTGTESIASLYNNGTPPDLSSYSNLERWYKLNAQDTFDGTDWTIKDYANNQDGTSVRMTSANLIQSNLQHTSGFSPYALNLSGGGEFMYTNISELTSISTITTSIWVKLDTTNFGYALNIGGNNSTEISFGYNSGKFFFYSGAVVDYAANPSSAGIWYNIVLTRSGETMKMYINGVLEATATGLTTLSLNDYVLIGKRSNGFNIAADVSNLAIWSSELTTSEITTLYNQGLPSNLSTFSTKPIFWSQFGTNSSFNAAANRWTSIDEILGNSVLSHTVMTEDDIVNGVGYSANGLGTSSIEIVGDAPYSTANGISENMDVLDRTTDVPG